MPFTPEQKKIRVDQARDSIGRLARHIYCTEYRRIGIEPVYFDDLDNISKEVWRQIGLNVLSNREARRLFTRVLGYEWENK